MVTEDGIGDLKTLSKSNKWLLLAMAGVWVLTGVVSSLENGSIFCWLKFSPKKSSSVVFCFCTKLVLLIKSVLADISLLKNSN